LHVLQFSFFVASLIRPDWLQFGDGRNGQLGCPSEVMRVKDGLDILKRVPRNGCAYRKVCWRARSVHVGAYPRSVMVRGVPSKADMVILSKTASLGSGWRSGTGAKPGESRRNHAATFSGSSRCSQAIAIRKRIKFGLVLKNLGHGRVANAEAFNPGLRAATTNLDFTLTLASIALCCEDRQRDLAIGNVMVDALGEEIFAGFIDFHRFDRSIFSQLADNILALCIGVRIRGVGDLK
jgi:hypothetical protein